MVAMKATVDGFQTVDEHSFFLDEAAEEEEAFASKIKDAKYEAVTLEEVKYCKFFWRERLPFLMASLDCIHIA
eukprot:3657539-Ditylum_brightwellii.AAC.1